MTEEPVPKTTAIETEPKEPMELFRNFLNIAGHLVTQGGVRNHRFSEHDNPNLAQIFEKAGCGLPQTRSALAALQENSFKGFDLDELEQGIATINSLVMMCDESELDERSDTGTMLLGVKQVLSSLIELRRLQGNHQ